MSTLRTLFGILMALTAAFAGGCGLFFSVMEFSPDMLQVAAMFGLAPAIVAGLLARWALGRLDGERRRTWGAKRLAAFVGGVVLIAIAVLSFLFIGFGSLYPDGIKMSAGLVFGLMLAPLVVGTGLIWLALRAPQISDDAS